MSKKGVSKIVGNSAPVVGSACEYTIAEWYPATPLQLRNPSSVVWELFKKRADGKFTSTGIRKKGSGIFTFGEVSSKHTYRLEAYLYRPEGKGPATIEIRPQPGTIPKIIKVDLLRINSSQGNIFSFMDRLVAQARCVSMAGKKIIFTLWEDDVAGPGHHASNLVIDRKEVFVQRDGMATAEFMLTKALMKKAMEGEYDTRELEFYVTAEYYTHRKHTSGNTEVKDQNLFVFEIPGRTLSSQPVPIQLSKAKGSPASGKPISKKEEKGLVEKFSDGFKELWDWQETKGTMKDTKPVFQKKEGKSVSMVEIQENYSFCICEQLYSDLIWGEKVSCEFRKKVILISKRNGLDPNNFMAAMAHETGGTFDPACGTFQKHRNESREGYVGLLQIGKDAATDIGITRTQLIKMNRVQQLDYIEKYLNLPLVKGKLNTLTDFYLAVLFPIDCGKGNQPDHIVFDNSLPVSYKSSGEPIKNLNYWRNVAYAANPAFHKEKKNEIGKTYVWEIADNIQKWYDNGKKHTVKDFLCEEIHNKREQDSRSLWYEPVDTPLSTIYMQSGNGGIKTAGEHWGLFGKTRNGSVHQGLDLFVEPGSNVYACIEGIIHKVTWHNGYGNTITVKITDKEAFHNYKRNYFPEYSLQGEIIQGNNFDETKDIFLFYAHLEEILVKEKDKVTGGELIAKSGVSGIKNGTCAPHLHFEIFSTLYAVGMGLNYRCNPGFYVNFKTSKEQSKEELDLQKKLSLQKIEDFYGKK